ncbi:MAG TPA: biosynthetic peptidoglycan transglycosylase, partial [Pseudonocardia sp.]
MNDPRDPRRPEGQPRRGVPRAGAGGLNPPAPGVGAAPAGQRFGPSSPAARREGGPAPGRVGPAYGYPGERATSADPGYRAGRSGYPEYAPAEPPPAREPELLTHHESANGVRASTTRPRRAMPTRVEPGGYPPGPGHPGGPPGPPPGYGGGGGRGAGGPRPRPSGWLLVRRLMLWAFLLFVCGPIVAFAIGWFTVPLPSPDATFNSQIATVLYADGKPLATVRPEGVQNRVKVPLAQVPIDVQHAVLSAEDRSFYSNPGFDVIGIIRAVWNQLHGVNGGGSTITQQYIKISTDSDQHTLWRKYKEVIAAAKISK